MVFGDGELGAGMGYCSWICFGLPGSTLVVEVVPSSLLLFAFTFTKFMIRYPIPPLEPLAHAQTFKGRRYFHSISIDDHAAPQKYNSLYMQQHTAYSIPSSLFPKVNPYHHQTTNSTVNSAFFPPSALSNPSFFRLQWLS